MIEVRKALAEDYESVVPLLLKFNPSKEVWKALFINHWNHSEDYFGYVLTDHGKVVGFLGAIFSTRIINNQEKKFCNLSAWIIDEAYRKHGLSLFLPVLQMEDYTVTNFSSAEKTYIISKKLGFTDVGTRLIYIPPIPQIRLGKRVEVHVDNHELVNLLSLSDQKIYQDHLKFEAHHVILRNETEYCYLVIKKEPAYLKAVYYLNVIFQRLFKTGKVKEQLRVGRVHYISNKQFFENSADFCVYKLCWKLKIIGLLTDERWMKRKPKHCKYYKTYATPLFKSRALGGENIDTLYSEHFLINTHS